MFEYQQIIENMHVEIQKQKMIIKDRDEKIKKLETENSHLQFRICKQIKAAWGRIKFDECDGPIDIIKDLEKQIEQLKSDLATFRNVSAQDYQIKIDLARKNDELKEKIKYHQIGYRNLLEQYNQAIKRRDELNKIIHDERIHRERLESELWEMNSKKSMWIEHWLHLKEQMYLLMSASTAQRFNKKNSQGVSYDQIKLKPEN